MPRDITNKEMLRLLEAMLPGIDFSARMRLLVAFRQLKEDLYFEVGKMKREYKHRFLES